MTTTDTNSGVTLDLSKSVPLSAPQSAPDSGITLDMSKSQALPANPSSEAQMFQQATSGQAIPTPAPQMGTVPFVSTLQGVVKKLSPIFQNTPEGRGSATSGAGAKELADQYNRDAEAADKGEITGAGVISGGLKGAGETVHTIGRAANAVTGDRIGALPNDFEQPEYLKATNTSEEIGKAGEGVLEFLAGDEALKGLSWTQKLQRTAKMADLLESHPLWAKAMSIGVNSLRMGVEAGAQNLIHTTDVGEATKAAAYGAGATAAVEGGASLLKPVLQKAITVLDTPRLAGQVEDAVAKLNADSDAFINGTSRWGTPDEAELSVMTKPMVDASGKPLTGQNLAQALQNDLDKVHRELTINYGNKLKEFAERAANAGIEVGGADSPIAQTARQILDNGSGLPSELQESLKGVTPSLDRAQALLEHLAKGEPMSWAEATELQKTLGAKAYAITDYSDPLKRVLINLKGAVGESLENAAEGAGQTGLADDLKALRTDYANTIDKLQDNSVIQAIRNRDLDGVAKLLMSRNTIGDNVTTLRSLLDRINSRNMVAVETEMFNKVLDDSADFSSGKRKIDFDKFMKNYFKIPDEVREEIWGSKLDNFENTVKYYKSAATEGGDIANKLQSYVRNNDLAQKLGYFGLRHGPASVPAAKLLWDVGDGKVDRIPADVAEIIALEGGTYALKNKGVQNLVMTALEHLSNASERTPLLFGNEVAGATEEDFATQAAKSAARGNTLHAGIPVGNPVGESAASEANAAQSGLPANTKVGDLNLGEATHHFNPETGAIEKIGGEPINVDVKQGDLKQSRIISANQGDKLAGQVIIVPANPVEGGAPETGGRAIVQLSGVREPRMGMGSVLYRRAISEARQAGFDTLESGTVLSDSADATWKRLQSEGYPITVNEGPEVGKTQPKYTLDLKAPVETKGAQQRLTTTLLSGTRNAAAPEAVEQDLTNELGEYAAQREFTHGVENQPTQRVAEAKAQEPAPRNANLPAEQQEPAGKNLMDVISRVRTSGSPMLRREVNALLDNNAVEALPNRLLTIDTDKLGTQMKAVVNELRTAHFRDLLKSGDSGLTEALHNAAKSVPEMKAAPSEAIDLGDVGEIPPDFKEQLQNAIEKLEALQSKKPTKELVGDVDTAALRRGLKKLLNEK